MDYDSQSEDGLTSLSDSTFEIISQSSFHASDEDAHDDGTESLVSFGMPTPDGSSIDGYELQETEPWTSEQALKDATPHVELSMEQQSIQSPPEVQLSAPSPDTSTVIQSFASENATAGSAEDWITFQDPIRGVASGLIDPTYPLNDDEKHSLECAEKVIEMTLAKKPLKLRNSFHIVFYTNHPELEHLKLAILEKIGQALLVSQPGSSAEDATLMNVIPISGAKEAHTDPEVMLLPSSGLQIKVDDLAALSFRTKDSQTGQLIFNGGRNGSLVRYEMIPDLFIFVHSDPSSLPNAFIDSIRESKKLKEVGTPVLDICYSAWDLYAEFINNSRTDSRLLKSYGLFDIPRNKALHISIPSKVHDVEVRVPIDFNAFQALDPIDLNRNIAAIQPRADLCSLMPLNLRRRFESFHFKRHWPMFLVVGLVLTTMIGFFVLQISGRSVTSKPISSSSAKPTIVPCSRSTSVVGQVKTTGFLKTLPLPEVPLLLSAPKASSKTRALTTMRVTSSLSIPSRIDSRSKKLITDKKWPDFHILESQDSRLFLQASRSLPRKWKAPLKFVHAVQGERPLDVSFSTINDTTFELQLAESRSCEPVILTVWPHQGQTASQTFQLSRPCSAKVTLHSIIDAYSSTVLDAGSNLMVTTTDLWTMVQQQGGDIYTRQFEHLCHLSERQALMVKDFVKVSIERAQQLNRNVDDVRIRFNTQADEAFIRFAHKAGERWKQIQNEFAESHFGFTKLQPPFGVGTTPFEPERMRRRIIEARAAARARFDRFRSMNPFRGYEHRHHCCCSNVASPHIKKARHRAVSLSQKLRGQKLRLWR